MGGGSRFIRLSDLPAGSPAHITTCGILPRSWDANIKPLPLLGRIRLHIRLGTRSSPVTFLDAKRLETPIILGCNVRDQDVEAIRPRILLVELEGATTILITRRPSKQPTTVPLIPHSQQYVPPTGRTTNKSHGTHHRNPTTRITSMGASCMSMPRPHLHITHSTPQYPTYMCCQQRYRPDRGTGPIPNIMP